MYPDTLLNKIKQNLRQEWRFAFCSAFCMGLLVHFYRLANHLITWDSVYNFHDSQNKTALGRIFLSLSCGISSYYDLQWVNGLLSLLYLSLTCVCLTELFSLRSRTAICLICGLTVAFPSVAGTFAYMYTADGYFLAQLTAVLAVLITVRYRRGFLGGMLLLAFSYGCYQAYISYAVMLILTWSILRLVWETDPLKSLFSMWLRFLIMGAAGTALYLLFVRLLSGLQGIAASDYNGISDMALPDGPGILDAARNCLIDFAYFFFGPLDRFNLFKLLNLLLFLLLAALSAWLLWKRQLYKTPGRLGMIFLCFASMPFVCSMIYFLSPQVRYYMLMYAGFSLLYILPVLLCVPMSQIPDTNRQSRQAQADRPVSALILTWSCFLLTAVTVLNFSLIANISYLYLTSANEKTFALVGRMTDRIEQLENYETLDKLCIIGHFEDFDTISLNLPPAMAGVRDSYLISEQAHFCAMMDTYFGLSLEPCSDEEKSAIQASDTFQAMDCWPAQSSMAAFGDTVVIKIEHAE